MKNKNFTTSVVAFLSRSSVLLLAILFWTFQQNAFAQTADCPLSSNDLVQVSLKDDCKATVTPEMIVEGEKEGATCNYEITTIVDEDGNQVGYPDSLGGVPTGNWILEGDKDYYDDILMGTVKIKDNPNNSTMGRLYIEDKVDPTLTCMPPLNVACSENLDEYLNANTDTLYERNKKKVMKVFRLDGGVVENFGKFPVTLNPGDRVEIYFDIENAAIQSEIYEYVSPEFGLENLNYFFGGFSKDFLQKDIGNHFYGIKVVDLDISGNWILEIHNNTGAPVTLDHAKVHVKSNNFSWFNASGVTGALAHDNCHEADLKIKVLSDITEDNSVTCGDWFKKRTIKYQAIDWVGNKSDVCEHVITWEKKGLDDLDWPDNYDGLGALPLSCTGFLMEKLPSGDLDTINVKWDTNGDGYPQPGEIDVPSIDGFPIYPDNYYCMINLTYTDEVDQKCPGTYKILRKWVAYDMCAAGSDDCCGGSNPRTHYQIIKVINNNKPVFSADMVDTVHFSTSTFKCESGCDFLPVPVIHSYVGCGGDLTYDVLYCPEGDGVYKYIGQDIAIDKQQKVCDLPIGETCITYVVKDECGNKAEGNLVVIIDDNVPPVPVCDEHTVATVTTNCIARVNAKTFDDGSIDNCDEDLDFLVKKMNETDDKYNDFVEYGSGDVGKTGVVILKVIDKAGNWNTCMVEVYIDDKITPTIECPKDVTIDCGSDPYDVATTGGEPEFSDNCTPTLLKPVYSGDLSQCGVGTITRTWTVTDGAKEASCSQNIHVETLKPFFMPYLGDTDYYNYWPADVTDLQGCTDADTDPSKTGEPNIDHDNFCSMAAATYTDRVFDVVQGACYKILRDWTVIDWCQYEENSEDLIGIWHHTQVIMVNDIEAPVFTAGCEDREIPAYLQDCKGLVDITADADDCTPDKDLVWSYRVYNSDNDDELVASGNSNRFLNDQMSVGNYRIHWVVEDKCGNSSECDMNFELKDAKNPTPLCYSEITTVVMPSTNPKVVQVRAKDFDRGSYDNCDKGVTCGDCDTELRFSFSGTNPNEKTRVFTDADVGIQNLDMWVWDRAGNRDFCNVTLHVQDNLDEPDGMVQLAGMIRTENGEVISNASVTVDNADLNETAGGANSNSNGYYQLDLPVNSGYEITVEKDDEYLNGITTLDIVLIQKHILNIRKISSPYKLLAADVNRDGRLTASDVFEIRKLILGKDQVLGSTDPWAFVDAGFEFSDPQHPWLESEEELYSVVLNNVQENSVSNDFIGLKLGDVNNTVDLTGTSQVIEARGMKSLTVDNVLFKADEYVSVPVYGSDFENINGLQMSINVNSEVMTFVDVEGGAMQISKGNYLIKDNQMNISWNSSDISTYNDDDVLFTLKLKSKKDGQLINQLQMGGRINPEVYDNEANIYSMELNYRGDNKVEEFVLYQNTPNPFSDNTEISFEIPQSGLVTVSIYDITGKEIVNMSREFEKGYNSVIVSKDDLKDATGVLYYKVKNNGNTIVKKMIVITK